MTTKLIELRPNRDLLNPDFEGYKLSLEKIPIYKQELETSIEKILPDNEQYSLLHARLFGLHNHLYYDQFNTESNIYFIDGNWNVQNIVTNNETGRLSEIKKVWHVPQCEEITPERYNFSLHFASKDVAVLSDGYGKLFILDTNNRNEEKTWIPLYSDYILDLNIVFMIVDAICLSSETNVKQLHCLLNHVEKNEKDGKFVTVINWVTLTQTEDNKWDPISLRVLKGSGQLHYCALENDCKFISIASDKPFKFILDSENAIIEKESTVETKRPKVYTWLQTTDDITLRFNVNSLCNKNNIKVTSKPFHISIMYNDIILLEGELRNRIDSDLTVWNISNNILEVTINKTENGLMWPECVKSDITGEEILDSSLVAEIHQRLAHLCSEKEISSTDTGPTYSSQQLEECDFAEDDTANFERFCGTTHIVTHRINIGSFQLITTVRLSPNLPPALVLRHDVDAILWQPMKSDNEWLMKHEGTFLALGYIQASKEQRKFSTCSTDLTYSVICDSTRHVFIYRQNRSILSGELRNRRSGVRVNNIAEQQVVSLDDDEILGIFASETFLYILTSTNLLLLKIKS